MITELSAYKAMIEASNSGNILKREDNVSSSADSVVSLSKRVEAVDGGGRLHADSIDMSASKDVFTAVESFFNLGKSGRFDDFHNLSREDKEQFVQIVAELAKSGYVGYEELIVNKKVERHEVLNQVGDQRLRNARVHDESKNPHR